MKKFKVKYPAFTLWALPHPKVGYTLFIQSNYQLIAESVHNLLTYIIHRDAQADLDSGYFLIASNKRDNVYYHVDYNGEPIHFPIGTTVRILENFDAEIEQQQVKEFDNVA